MEVAGGVGMVGNLAKKLDNYEIEITEAPVKWCSVSLSEVVDKENGLKQVYSMWVQSRLGI